MIQKILKKALKGYKPEDGELIQLFRLHSQEDFTSLMETAFEIKRNQSRSVKLTSTVHITNKCRITPKCEYCGFAAGTTQSGYYRPFFKTSDEILQAVHSIEKSGIPRVSCSGAHGYRGEHAVNAARIVKEHTDLELLVNVGADLTRSSLKKIAGYNTDTVCCNLETVNMNLFHQIKPGEKLHQRIAACEMVSELGVELSSGLLIGIGESFEDRIAHLKFIRCFKTLGEIPIMGFNPYKGTPMEHHPPCSLQDQMKTIAITRILYPDIRITVPTPTIGPDNVKFSLSAGADNIATVIPDSYPHDIKGVGSPVYGTLREVIKSISELGLTPELRSGILPQVSSSLPVPGW
jgi:biotin synthase